MPIEDAAAINQHGWDRLVQDQNVWTRPVSPEVIRRARQGDWSVVLSPNRPIPRDWLGEIDGKDILCLASGGGQQGPVFAAAGANVTVFDASKSQLAQDEAVAQREGLSIATLQGFMHDLSALADASFDIVFHPISNCFAPEILPVWRECYRVLRRGGVLVAGFMNPVTYIFDPIAQDRGELVVRFPLPYADTKDLAPNELAYILEHHHTVEFSHSLEDQIGGQLSAGFVLTGLQEDRDLGAPDVGCSRYFPTTITTRALKM